jgi:hypothetical protein
MTHENFPAGYIITDGLGGNANVVAEFNLFLGSGGSPSIPSPIQFTVNVVGGGGSLEPRIHYPQQSADDETIWFPREDEERQVIIKMRIGTKEFERHYFVRKRTSVVVTQVLHFLNITQSRVNIGVGKITQTVKEIGIALRNIGKKP